MPVKTEDLIEYRENIGTPLNKMSPQLPKKSKRGEGQCN